MFFVVVVFPPHDYVSAVGDSSVDYNVCSKELAEQDMEPHVAEKVGL